MELIVVIVILGILAAIAAPALTGYIDRSRSTVVIEECRQMVVAAQTIATSRHASDAAVPEGKTVDPLLLADIAQLGEKPETGTIHYVVFNKSIVTELLYSNNDIYVLYKNDTYTIVEAPPELTFVDVTKATDVEAARLDNARSLARLFSTSIQSAIDEVAPPGAVSWNKGSIGVVSSLGGANFMDANGKKLEPSNLTIDITGIKTTLRDNGMTVPDNVQLFAYFNPVNGPSQLSLTPSYIQFKNPQLSGGSTDNDWYTYFIDSDVLVKGRQSAPPTP